VDSPRRPEILHEGGRVSERAGGGKSGIRTIGGFGVLSGRPVQLNVSLVPSLKDHFNLGHLVAAGVQYLYTLDSSARVELDYQLMRSVEVAAALSHILASGLD
jgi:hypothetical protein